MSIFDGLLNPAVAGGAFQQGMEQGRAEREEREVRGALSAYAVNPDDPAAFQSLAQYRPELAIQIGQQRRKQQEQLAVQDLQRRAATGDKAAMAQLAGVDLDAWSKLDSATRARAKEQNEIIGQAALTADTPEEWDNQIRRLGAAGIDASEYLGRFDLREATLAKAGLMKQFIDMTEPKYQAVPEGGTLVNVNDPVAVRSFAAGSPSGGLARPASKADYDALPPGARYAAPDGSIRTKPGGAGGNVSSNFLDGL